MDHPVVTEPGRLLRKRPQLIGGESGLDHHNSLAVTVTVTDDFDLEAEVTEPDGFPMIHTGIITQVQGDDHGYSDTAVSPVVGLHAPRSWFTRPA